MIKLALVGRNIQHSRSPEIYRRLIGEEIQYDLLDYSDENSIPKAEEIFLRCRSISITSPYKKHFLNEVELTPMAKELGAINCLGLKNGKIIGENTDYLAILDILKNWQSKYKHLNIIILGDGVMSKVTEVALLKLKIKYRVYSRRMVDSFDQINLKAAFGEKGNQFDQNIVINTCAREFIFQGTIDKNTIFWDYNYNFIPHSSSLPSKVKQYCDGLEMLELQARHALVFWSIKSTI